jgi:peptide-methionine (S)-S-oxide reductase
MKKVSLYIACLLLLAGCVNGQSRTDFANLPQVKTGDKVADFAGGCFWAMSESLSELRGVDAVVSGYAGGTTIKPTYEEVCSDNTGHAETVQVYYNPSEISYEKLAEAFFYAHNPTELNYQGPDEGTSYRSVAFYRTPEEKATLDAVIKKINASKYYSGPIVTQVVPYKVFYPGEEYHQNYFKLHPDNGYIEGVSLPKVEKMRKIEKAQLKPQYQ